LQTPRLSALPVASGVHVPRADDSAQLRHAPPHVSLQHTPSTQNVDAQSAPFVQADPFASLPQL
jgi:hypothetical protein